MMRLVFVWLLFTSFIGLSLGTIWIFTSINSKIDMVKSQKIAYLKLSEISKREILLYENLVSASELNREVLSVLPFKPRRILFYHIASWLSLQILKIFVAKNEKIEMNMNLVFMGENGKLLIRGYFDASRYYFCKPMQDLEIDELAQLFALRKAPKIAGVNSDKLKTWRDQIINIWLFKSVIPTKEHATRLLNQPVLEWCH